MDTNLGTTAPTLLATALTLVVGVLLGMVGGGGSIIVVPILVYVLKLPVTTAVGLSLPIVGVTALVGATAKARRGQVHFQAAALFGLAGGMGAVGGARLTHLLPPSWLLLIFAVLLVAVGQRMWQGSGPQDLACDNHCEPTRCLSAGLGVGILTGFLGVGGGFLLVPALKRFANQTVSMATGTSLAIIALNSAAGFAAHLSDVRAVGPLGLALIAAALAGLALGLGVGARVPARHIEKTFGVVALSVAIFLVMMNAGPAFRLVWPS